MGFLTMMLFVLGPVTSAVTLDESVTLSRCRAQCAASYIREITSRRDQHCVRSGECLECWQTCHQLTQQPQQHGGKCAEAASSVCSTGCQTSCDFMRTLAQEQGPDTDKYTLTTHLNINNKTFFLINVHLDTMEEDSGRIVFSLLLKHKDSSQWRYQSFGP